MLHLDRFSHCGVRGSNPHEVLQHLSRPQIYRVNQFRQRRTGMPRKGRPRSQPHVQPEYPVKDSQGVEVVLALLGQRDIGNKMATLLSHIPLQSGERQSVMPQRARKTKPRGKKPKG